MIIARIESLICGKPIEDALERASAYVKAGADGIMIHSKDKSGEDIRQFCKLFLHPGYCHSYYSSTYDLQSVYGIRASFLGDKCGDICQSHVTGFLSGDV